MVDYILNLSLLLIIIGFLFWLSQKLKHRSIHVKSENDSIKVVDRCKLSFQTELLVVEHDGVTYTLLNNQGNFSQLFKDSISFEKMVVR